MDSFETIKKIIPWGSSTRSKSYKRFPDNWPKLIDDAYGCWIRTDNKTYLDFLSAQGPIILGYRNSHVDQAVINQILYKGNLFSLPHKLEGEVAEILCSLIPCAEQVYFLKNGGDATAAAVRLARKVTGKYLVLNRGYHGWFTFDQIKSFSILSDLDCQGDIAGILIEPELFTKEELIEIRRICNNNNIILIFDEVITGFRVALGGVQEYYGVIPDLACFSKAMANGYPISALVGKKIYMQRLEDDVFVSSTFGGDCIGLIAAKTTIAKLIEYNVVEQLWDTGTYLKEKLKDLIVKYDFPMKLHGQFPQMLHFEIPQDLHPIFLQEMIKRGIMIYNSHNLNLCHTKKIIDKLLSVYNEVFPLIKNNKVKLEGNPLGNIQLFRAWR